MAIEGFGLFGAEGEGEMKTKKLDLRFNEVHQNIKIMCEGLRSLSQSGLKNNLLILMLMDQTGLNKTQCRAVLDALPRLERAYLK